MDLRFVRLTAGASLLAVLAACAPSNYTVRQPAPSTVPYEAGTHPTTLAVTGTQSTGGFMTGTLLSTLVVDGRPIEPMPFLTTALQAEFAARGLDVQVAGDASAFPRLDVRTFRMQNHRTNAYTPYITLTFLSADLETAAGKKRLGVFVKRGKVPVWSFDEIVEPTLNEPMSIAVKELASKVANELYGARAPEAAVDTLLGQVAALKGDDYQAVYALGFTNHPKAIEVVAALTTADPEYVRIAAISSLGNLRAVGQFERLKGIYGNAKLWQDRAMALKAIGDLGTPEALAFLQEQKARWQQQTADKESEWTLSVIDLYL